MIGAVKKAIFNSDSFSSQVILGVGQLCAHLSLLYVIFNFSWSWLAVSAVVYFLMTSIGVSVTAHRFLSHRSFGLPRYFEIVGSILFSWSLQGSTIAWVAMHKEHHRHADTNRDPHNPAGHFWRTHFFSMFYTPKIKYAVALMRDPFHERIHRYYWWINAGFGLATFLAFGGLGLVYIYLFPAFLCWHAIGIAKTMAHTVGYRNFANVKDNSFNIPVLGYLTFGEAWHNNHHARPAHWSFAFLPHEVDISGLVILMGKKFLGFSDVWRANG